MIRVRFAMPLLILSALLLPAAAGARAAGDPTITLVSPANGSTVYSAIWMNTYPTFTWHIDWPDVATSTQESTVLVTITTATDPYFTQDVTQDNHMCPVQNLNCWSYSPSMVWGMTPGRKWYWRVGVNTSHGFVYSQTSSFTATPPPDRTPPRVRTLPGSGRRGQIASVNVRAGDDRGEVRFRIMISGYGRTLIDGVTDFTKVNWSTPAGFSTESPLPYSARPGRYRVCVTGWDHAGHKSPRSCASYTIS
jgi:hypothetical protein